MRNFYTESLPRQQLTKEIKDNTLDCVASPTSKAFPSLARIT